MSDPKNIFSKADEKDMVAYAAAMRGLPFSEDDESEKDDALIEGAARRQELLDEIDRLEGASRKA